MDLRARWYQPQTGQFVQRDPLEDQTAQPYAYAADDPVNNSDPSGQCYIPNTHRDAALPDVPPGDQPCSGQTLVDITSGILTPQRDVSVIYPSAADRDCIYNSVLRNVPGARVLLQDGFYVSRAKQVRTVVETNGTLFERAFSSVVAIGRHAGDVAAAVAKDAEKVYEGVETVSPIVEFAARAPQVAAAVVAGTIAGIVTQPTLHDADTPEDLLITLQEEDYDRQRRDIPTVCFSLGRNQRPPFGCSALARPVDIRVPEVARHIVYAQLMGYGVQLTYIGAANNKNYDDLYDYHRELACPDKRRDELRRIQNDPTLTCDEYPFASTFQGGGRVSTFGVPVGQNRLQGRILAAFYDRQFNYEGPSEFNVNVVL